jgi:hypothetical protein
MARYYFHKSLNGQMAMDRRGHEFANAEEACEHALYRTPILLRKIVRPTYTTHLATEISDGKRIVAVVNVLIEKERDVEGERELANP